jgi:glucose-1-phosphate adenylyltransferase
MLDKTLAIILAGGVGSRLQPLTNDRAKPAVPFGGKYRIIDFTLANCLHSEIRQVLVLTQYKSHSLQKHLREAGPFLTRSLASTSRRYRHKCASMVNGTPARPMRFTRICT